MATHSPSHDYKLRPQRAGAISRWINPSARWLGALVLLLVSLTIGCAPQGTAGTVREDGFDTTRKPGGQAATPAASGQTMGVRYTEGTVHSFLVLKNAAGALLAYGDQVQIVQGTTADNRMIFRFLDNSYYEERVTYGHNGVFRLRTYSQSFRGPSFGSEQQIFLDASTGRYSVSVRPQGKKAELYEGRLDLPADVCNGIMSNVAKNNVTTPSFRLHIVGFDPKPRIVELDITAVPTEPMVLSNASRPTVHFVVHLKLDAFTSFMANMVGKTPPDSHLWFMQSDVPVFLWANTALAPQGPVWRIEPATPLPAR